MFILGAGVLTVIGVVGMLMFSIFLIMAAFVALAAVLGVGVGGGAALLAVL